MPTELEKLRDQIDAVDSELVALLARRAALTEQVGLYKSKVGLPVYVPAREAELIEQRCEQAKAMGVPPTLAFVVATIGTYLLRGRGIPPQLV